MAPRLVKITVGDEVRVIDLARLPELTNTAALPELSGYLPNPGMGYQGWTHDIGALETTVEYRRGPHPEQGGFDWATLNPAEGVYHWDPVDGLLVACAARGERGSFRIVTMLGDEFGGHRVPQWVVNDGLVVLDGGEPDYRCRAYQQHWGAFVDALAARYDGDPRLAFVDISGYGKFNEWQGFEHTDWADDLGTGSSVDSSAKRHLIHMFVGGADTAKVVEADGVTDGTLAYSHTGFQQTQLVMPYGGMWGPTRYVLDNYGHVGFRNDALMGPDGDLASFQAIGHGIGQVWRAAPVVFEPIFGATKDAYPAAAETMAGLGATFLHDNSLPADADLEVLVERVGYRYHCSQIHTVDTVTAGAQLPVRTTWSNTGWGRAYPSMGQDFAMCLGLADGPTGAVVAAWTTGHAVSGWLPGDTHVLVDVVTVPAEVAPGVYTLLVGVVEQTTDTRIALPVDTAGRTDRWYPTVTITVD